MSPGLIRARRRFFLPNLLTGMAVAGFAVGVWAYSISAVKQDVFDDIDEEARALDAEIGSGTAAVPISATAPASLSAVAVSPLSELVSTSLKDGGSRAWSVPRGVMYAALGNRFPGLFEPTRKTLIWTAPPVDNIGRIGDRIPIHVTWRKA